MRSTALWVSVLCLCVCLCEHSGLLRDDGVKGEFSHTCCVLCACPITFHQFRPWSLIDLACTQRELIQIMAHSCNKGAFRSINTA